ncbi:putative nuclease HARBI1 [Lineus longissimus]|uniref:putative nuclease HARBI1 n=1 Tax=Lineus longissimus TaxID=88925 RepID=UPI00315DF80A
MAAFMHVRAEKLYMNRKTCRPGTYRTFYRFDEVNVEWLATHFLPDSPEMRGGSLTNKESMETFLRYLSDPGFQVGVGEDKGIHQSTVCKTFSNVLTHVVAKAQIWIKFPATLQDIREAQQLWQTGNEIPDCTHVKILKPGARRSHGDEYINRKGSASINVQATCNAVERFTSVDACWPGSVHDSRIWKYSDVGRTMIHSRHGGLLLGDEGYGIAPWLLTPYSDPVLPFEKAFNRAHSKEKVIIERCFGQVKRRFPILNGKIRVRLVKVPSVIVACFMLHNISKYLDDQDDFPELENDEPDTDSDDDEDDEDGDRRIRQRGQNRRRVIAELLNSD